MSFRNKKLTMTVAILTTVLVVILVALSIRPTPPPFVRSPVPNGYDTLVEAANKRGDISHDFKTYNLPEFLESNSGVYMLISNALNQPAEAPPSTYQSGRMKTMQDLMAFRGLERALIAKSQFLSHHSKAGKAADLLIDIVHLGQQVEHGPLISFMVGSAIEMNGTRKLAGLLSQLHTNELLHLSQQIQELNRSRLPYDEIAARERYYIAVNTRNPLERIKDLVKGQSREALEEGRERYLNTAALEEVTLGTVAIRLFTLQDGHSPKSMRELSTRYVTDLRDPYSGKPLLMKTATNTTFVYSVGVNGIDDSGQKDDVKLDHEDAVGARMLIRGLSNQ